MVEPLLPDRYPQADFFIADIFEGLPFKDDMASMEHPIFSLQTNPQYRALEYQRGDVTLRITPSINGLPTIHDKDVMLYCCSHLMEQFNRGRKPPKKIRLSAHDILVATNQKTDGRAYKRLQAALERLAGVLITTSIKTNGRRASEGFHIIDGYRIVEKSATNNRMVNLEITVSDWFYNSCEAGEVLTISRDYFRLRKPIERRLYELARKHCGKQESWTIGLEALQAKTGSSSPLKKFRFMISKVAETDHLPDYRITLDRGKDLVTFYSRAHDESADTPAILIALQSLTGETVHKARLMAHKAGRDFDTIRDEFADFLAKKGAPRNINGAFIGFVRKKVRK